MRRSLPSTRWLFRLWAVRLTVLLVGVGLLVAAGVDALQGHTPELVPSEFATFRLAEDAAFLERAQEASDLPILIPTDLPEGTTISSVSIMSRPGQPDLVQLGIQGESWGPVVVNESRARLQAGGERRTRTVTYGGTPIVVVNGEDVGRPDVVSAYWSVGDANLSATALLGPEMTEEDFLMLVRSFDVVDAVSEHR